MILPKNKIDHKKVRHQFLVTKVAVVFSQDLLGEIASCKGTKIEKVSIQTVTIIIILTQV